MNGPCHPFSWLHFSFVYLYKFYLESTLFFVFSKHLLSFYWMLTLLKLKGPKVFTVNVLFQLYIVSGILPHLWSDQVQNSSVMADLLYLHMRVPTNTFTAWFLFMPHILQNCQETCVITNCLQIYQSYVKNTSNRCKNKTSTIASNFHVGGNLRMSCRMRKDSVWAWRTCVYMYVATGTLGAWLTLIKTSRPLEVAWSFLLVCTSERLASTLVPMSCYQPHVNDSYILVLYQMALDTSVCIPKSIPVPKNQFYWVEF